MTRTEADDVIALMRQLESGQICDAMEEAGLPRAVLTGLVRLGARKGPMVGRAVTVQQRRKTQAEPREARLVRHREMTDGLAGPGEVIVIATGGITDVASWGENHGLRCVVRGIEGCLTDGATRDAETLEDGPTPVFCRGFSPVKSLWDMATESVNQPVVIDGVTIRKGDVIFADRTGAMVISAEHLVAIATRAYDIRRTEMENQDRLARDAGIVLQR